MMPGWLPDVAVTYLAHTSAGLPIRALARARGCHASTVLRQIRRVEAWRDDPLVDEALERIARLHAAELTSTAVCKELPLMPNTAANPIDRSDPRIEREARRILRRLCEKGAFLAVAPQMEKAVVLREVVPGRQNRIAVVDRDVAHAFALQEWIACERAGKIACYTITAVGRAALKRLLTEERLARAPQATPEVSPRRRRPSRSSIASSPSVPCRPRTDPASAGCASTLPKARCRCWGASATAAAPPTCRRTSSRRANGCARTSSGRRWGRGWRRTGSAS